MLNQITMDGTFEKSCQSPRISMYSPGENLYKFKFLTRKFDFLFHTAFPYTAVFTRPALIHHLHDQVLQTP